MQLANRTAVRNTPDEWLTIGTAARAVVEKVDPRAVFLLRAAARYELFAAGEMELDEAIDGLADAFDVLRPCTCAREIYERLERYRPRQPRRRRA